MIKFYAQNLIYSSSLSTNSENSQYPLSNLKSDFRTKVYRSTQYNPWILIDLKSIETIDAVCLSANWQDGWGFDTFTIEGNATDDFGSPAFSTTLTYSDKFLTGIKAFTTSQSYRYWRVKPVSSMGFAEISNIYIGKQIDIETNGIKFGWNYQMDDLVRSKSTVYGQKFFDDYGTQKKLTNLGVDIMNKDEVDEIFKIYDICRTVKPFFFEYCDSSSNTINDPDRFTGQYRFVTEPQINNVTSGFYNISFNLEEQK